MDFLEFHELAVQDDLFQTYLIRHLDADVSSVWKKERYFTREHKVVYIKSGVFVCEESSQIWKPGEYIYDMNKTIFSCEGGEVAEFDREDIICLLDQENLLSNFYLLLVEQMSGHLNFATLLFKSSPQQRIQRFLNELNQYTETPLHVDDVGVYRLSDWCYCSTNTVRAKRDQMMAAGIS
ncbi:hypothetical protein [Paenilisteria rocourtiae]|uniref:CRP-like cAMP-binding protein n=1 Tax=Listeria rocourtiae TaxID=647910 RepID=A0A4R6ZIQ6_9LIST|nr:hypothetical protein [Listeria rocourtiae]EUJ42239.1 hypothetical protein PROCOU_17640 [Listeria rocourtiae FSL F6-920]MBC1605051.1 hypothetical protein [Listeria rocourtiae]TDR52217.1 hypothetical protein DFP96_109107 [Listeria rocourtiae]